jgi:hypothetical protein
MERRLNKKIEQYLSGFKDEIREKARELGVTKNESGNLLLQFVYDYDRLTLGKDDFVKRKRVKNVVSYFDRCCAKRATDEQCTRRKKEGCEYCGTHLKGTPHGIMEGIDTIKTTSSKMEVWAQEMQGIIYYIDKNGNVYQAEDIVVNKINPRIIGKYEKKGDVFTIPEFGISSISTF